VSSKGFGPSDTMLNDSNLSKGGDGDIFGVRLLNIGIPACLNLL
jgi:hypothetical protein